MKEILISIREFLGLAWWVEVVTESPSCTYYFGPFEGITDAEAMAPGYIEDLQAEGAKGFRVTIKRCKPTQLTICEDDGWDEGSPVKVIRTMSPALSARG